MAKGIYASWDRLGNISAAINHIQTIKRQVVRKIAGYKGSTHTSPNTTNLVFLIANKAREDKIQVCNKSNQERKPCHRYSTSWPSEDGNIHAGDFQSEDTPNEDLWRYD